MPSGGVLSGASTGATIGTAVMPGIGTAVGAGLGGLVGWLSSRNDRTNEERQDTLNILNNYLASVNAEKVFNPSRPFNDLLRGQRIASSEERPGLVDPSGGLGQSGSFFAGRETRGPDAEMQKIIQSLRDPSTFSLRDDGRGGLVFDPNAINPLNLARSQGSSREGGFQLGGQEQFFGQNQSFAPPSIPAGSPPPPQPPRQLRSRRPDEASA